MLFRSTCYTNQRIVGLAVIFKYLVEKPISRGKYEWSLSNKRSRHLLPVHPQNYSKHHGLSLIHCHTRAITLNSETSVSPCVRCETKAAVYCLITETRFFGPDNCVTRRALDSTLSRREVKPASCRAHDPNNLATLPVI